MLNCHIAQVRRSLSRWGTQIQIVELTGASVQLVILVVFTSSGSPVRARRYAEAAVKDDEFLVYVAETIPGSVPLHVLRSLL